jgi:hypothetical protein
LPEPMPQRKIDSRDAVRAIGITAIVANHALAVPVHGGLNLLLLLSGLAFAQLCFGGRGDAPLVTTVLRFVRPLALWSILSCLAWFAIFGRFEAAELLMVSNWITTERVSKFPIWYTQVLLQMLAGFVLLLSIPGAVEGLRMRPVSCSLLWLGGLVLLAGGVQFLVNTDHLADKLPHLHAWNFVLGWVLWAVLYAQGPTGRERVTLSLLCLPLLIFMFLGLGVPGAEARVWVAIPAILVLIWMPSIRLPQALAHPMLLVAQSVLYIFFLHYPFILAVRNLFAAQLDPAMLGAAKFAAGLVGPVLIWAIATAAQRTFAHARMTRSGRTRVARSPTKTLARSAQGQFR